MQPEPCTVLCKKQANQWLSALNPEMTGGLHRTIWGTGRGFFAFLQQFHAKLQQRQPEGSRQPESSVRRVKLAAWLDKTCNPGKILCVRWLVVEP
jgi:hypothetical protein